MNAESGNDSRAFCRYRFKYYERDLIRSLKVKERVFNRGIRFHPLYDDLMKERARAIEQIQGMKPEFVIVTATKDRPAGLSTLNDSLQSQRVSNNWLWIVIHNSNVIKPEEVLQPDARRVNIRFVEQTGCAYPVRNFGLDFVYLGLENLNVAPRVMMVDDDDHFHNAYSLHELLKIGSAMFIRRFDPGLIHGLTIMDKRFSPDGSQQITEPHDISSRFGVGSLKEVFDNGIISTSGCFPIEFLTWLRYPMEKTVEDNGFNHKLLLGSQTMNRPWVGEKYPVIFRGYDNKGLTAKNSQTVSEEKPVEIGLYRLTGLRANMARRIKFITDVFTAQKL